MAGERHLASNQRQGTDEAFRGQKLRTIINRAMDNKNCRRRDSGVCVLGTLETGHRRHTAEWYEAHSSLLPRHWPASAGLPAPASSCHPVPTFPMGVQHGILLNSMAAPSAVLCTAQSLINSCDRSKGVLSPPLSPFNPSIPQPLAGGWLPEPSQPIVLTFPPFFFLLPLLAAARCCGKWKPLSPPLSPSAIGHRALGIGQTRASQHCSA